MSEALKSKFFDSGVMVNFREEKFGAVTLLVEEQSEKVLAQALEQFVCEYHAAIYFEIPLSCGLTYPTLRNRFGFKPYRFDLEAQSMVFYRWNGAGPDKVPEYATSIEGGCAMVVDETGEMVILVNEPGRGWKFVSEAVHSGELKLEAFLRGMLEELHLSLELKDLPIRKIGGYNQSCARAGRINDSFDIYLVTLPMQAQLTPDGDEVTQYKWVTLESLAEGKVEGVWGGLVKVAEAYRDNPTGGLVGTIRDSWNGGLKIDFTIPPPDLMEMEVTLTDI